MTAMWTHSDLIVLFDTNLFTWLQVGSSPLSPESAVNALTSVIEQTLVYCNAYLVLRQKNRVSFISCNPSDTRTVYPDPQLSTKYYSQTFAETPHSTFLQLQQAVTSALRESIKTQARNWGQSARRSSPIAAALTQAMCILERISVIASTSVIESKQKDQSLTDFSEKSSSNLNGEARILIVSPGHTDAEGEYIPMMNAVFLGQRRSIVIDAVQIIWTDRDGDQQSEILLDQAKRRQESGGISKSKESTLLQQAAYITGGLYHGINVTSDTIQEAFLHALLFIFLPDPSQRVHLALPSPHEVDFRATCFATHQTIDIGFACSVCLSTFAKFAPVCTTCGSRFAIQAKILPPQTFQKKSQALQLPPGQKKPFIPARPPAPPKAP